MPTKRTISIYDDSIDYHSLKTKRQTDEELNKEYRNMLLDNDNEISYSTGDKKSNEIIDYLNYNKSPSINYNKDEISRLLSAKDEILQSLQKDKPKYIGGKNYRQDYINSNDKIKNIINKKSKVYNISSELLSNRLAHEGVIDALINDNNRKALYNPNKFSLLSNFYNLKNRKQYGDTLENYNKGFMYFGLDDVSDYIDKGLVKLKDNEQYYQGLDYNEKGRRVNSASGSNFEDNVGLMAATLEYMRNKAKQDHPGLTDKQYDELASKYYNYGPYSKFSKRNGGKISLETLLN